MPYHPMFFSCTHPDFSFKLYFLGVSHFQQYSLLPNWCKHKIASCQTLLHEGANGVVFIDPFWTPLAFKTNQDRQYYDWMRELSPAEQILVQKVINHYCLHVKGLDFKAPRIRCLRFWAIDSIVQNFSYFYKGGEIDYTVHNIFKSQNKKIIDLDSEFLKKEIQKYLLHEHLALQEKLNIMDSFKMGLKNCKVFFERKTCDHDLEDGVENNNFPTHKDFVKTVDIANCFAREDPECSINRNTQFMHMINKNIAEQINFPNDSMIMVGANHLPDLFMRLQLKGCKIYQEYENYLLPLNINLHSFRIEIRAYENLRNDILGYSPLKLNWLQQTLKTNYENQKILALRAPKAKGLSIKV